MLTGQHRTTAKRESGGRPEADRHHRSCRQRAFPESRGKVRDSAYAEKNYSGLIPLDPGPEADPES